MMGGFNDYYLYGCGVISIGLYAVYMPWTNHRFEGTETPRVILGWWATKVRTWSST
jgi:hypothetical protein